MARPIPGAVLGALARAKGPRPPRIPSTPMGGLPPAAPMGGLPPAAPMGAVPGMKKGGGIPKGHKFHKSSGG